MIVSILCKGPSIQDIDYNSINSSDIITWANLHNPFTKNFKLPNRLDILFIRNRYFIDDLDNIYKKYLSDINIKELYCINHRPINQDNYILNYKIIEYLSNLSPYGFDASTGLIALNKISSRKNIKKIIIAGLDLFKSNEPLYYFDSLDNLTSNDNKKNISKFIHKDIIINEVSHHPIDSHIHYINKIINSNTNIEFEFYTRNDDLKSIIKSNKNVIIK